MSEKKPQTYENHARLVLGFHGVLTCILSLALIGAVTEVVRSMMRGSGRLDAVALLLVVIGAAQLFWYSRIFALKAQDRAIRAEENLRHFVLTGKLLDPRLGALQIVALRFAPDGELPDLAQRAAEEGLAPSAIKKSIRTWRPDTYRV
jgi:hypothetical protein